MNYYECKDIVEQIVADYITNLDSDPRIKSGMEYVLDGGKRLRPVLTLAILEKLIPNEWHTYKKVCLVPEFIHCSSLIIDDLPAFDNAETRRGKKCIHLEKDEGIAYLLSFNLVTEAVLLAHSQLPQLKENYPTEVAYQKYEEQLKNIILNISCKRAIGGQLLSTFHTAGETNLRNMTNVRPPKMTREEICDILYKKTSSFFDIAVVTGWIIGRGDLEKLDTVHKLANLLGLCYQIFDDFVDYHEDVNSSHFSHNYVYHRGLLTAMNEYEEYRQGLLNIINDLDLDCPVFNYIISYMDAKIADAVSTLKESVDEL